MRPRPSHRRDRRHVRGYLRRRCPSADLTVAPVTGRIAFAVGCSDQPPSPLRSYSEHPSATRASIIHPKRIRSSSHRTKVDTETHARHRRRPILHHQALDQRSFLPVTHHCLGQVLCTWKKDAEDAALTRLGLHIHTRTHGMAETLHDGSPGAPHPCRERLRHGRSAQRCASAGPDRCHSPTSMTSTSTRPLSRLDARTLTMPRCCCT